MSYYMYNTIKMANTNPRKTDMTNPLDIQEDWRPVRGYESLYEVSSKGSVRSVARVIERAHPKNPARVQVRAYGGRVLRLQNSRQGYVSVGLWRQNRGHTHDVHVLVCEAFLGSRAPGMDVNHKDGNRKNNHIENLEWVTRRENLMHAEQTLGKKMVWAHQKERAAQRRSAI